MPTAKKAIAGVDFIHTVVDEALDEAPLRELRRASAPAATRAPAVATPATVLVETARRAAIGFLFFSRSSPNGANHSCV